MIESALQYMVKKKMLPLDLPLVDLMSFRVE